MFYPKSTLHGVRNLRKSYFTVLEEITYDVLSGASLFTRSANDLRLSDLEAHRKNKHIQFSRTRFLRFM